jgi:hypothetical protein
MKIAGPRVIIMVTEMGDEQLIVDDWVVSELSQ